MRKTRTTFVGREISGVSIATWIFLILTIVVIWTAALVKMVLVLFAVSTGWGFFGIFVAAVAWFSTVKIKVS